jgi:hypothetical protein
MRFSVDGDYAHGLDAIEAAMDALDENTKTDAVIAACEHARQDRRAKEQALDHPDMTPELVEVLSTREMERRDDVSTSIEVE